MNEPSGRRRAALSLLLWGFIGAVVAVALISLARLGWQQGRQIEALEAEVTVLRSEQQALKAQAAAAQSTAAALDARLATVETSEPLQTVSALQATLEAADDSREVAELHAALDEIQAQVVALQAALNNPASGGQPDDGLPSEQRLTVARQRQSRNLSCESSAASMVAQYHGVALSEAEVLNALPLDDNPHLGFRGSVDGPPGGIEDYGVYAGPILSILNNRGLQAELVEGGLAGIKAAIARGNPVIAWVTYNCLAATPVETLIDGQPVTLVPYQHVVVVTGYNAEGVWANDPWDGREDFYATPDFERALSYFGEMAIEVAAP